jgi:hypothetical protein
MDFLIDLILPTALAAGSWGREELGNPEEVKRQPLEAVTRKPVKTQQAEKT